MQKKPSKKLIVQLIKDDLKHQHTIWGLNLLGFKNENSTLDICISVFSMMELNINDRHLEHLTDQNKEQKDGLKEQIKNAILIIPKLLERYRNSNVQEKKKLIGSIFPEKFVFQNNKVRITELNEVFALFKSNSRLF